MNIAFLCSSLAAGRDGVGDYTRSLAEACQSRGHRSLLVALRDGHTENQSLGEEECGRVLRSPAGLPLPERVRGARLALEAFSPDVVSWQFVSYGYHRKGLVGREAGAFVQLQAGGRRHVMLHELWIGIDQHEPWRNRVVGAWQRRGLLRWLRALRPHRLHTSNTTYQRILAHQGWSADVLPLFGNLPIAPARPDALAPWLPGGGRGGWLVAVTFGTLHPQWEPEIAAARLRELAARRGQSLLLLACGRPGAHGPGLLRRFASAAGAAVAATDELPAERLSAILQAADCGIAPHPWALLGKSGAAAALLEHGLPVLVPRDDWRPRHDLPSSGAPGYDPLCARLTDLPEASDWEAWLSRRRIPQSRRSEVAAKFLSSIGG